MFGAVRSYSAEASSSSARLPEGQHTQQPGGLPRKIYEGFKNQRWTTTLGLVLLSGVGMAFSNYMVVSTTELAARQDAAEAAAAAADARRPSAGRVADRLEVPR